jgi:nitrite reductase/ring-hydroxylating ferredoxin subunit
MALIAVCRVDEVPEAKALCRNLPDGLHIALARVADAPGRFVAFENRCPHYNAPIGMGRIKDGIVTCPWHFFRFDIRSGEAVGLPSTMRLRMFPTLVNEQQIYIDV